MMFNNFYVILVVWFQFRDCNFIVDFFIYIKYFLKVGGQENVAGIKTHLIMFS